MVLKEERSCYDEFASLGWNRLPENPCERVDRLMLNRIKHWVNLFLRLSVMIASKCTAALLRPSGAETTVRDVFAKHGYYLLPKHYDLPIPDELDMTGDFYERGSGLVGVDMNDKDALALLENLFPRYVQEFRSLIPTHRTNNPKQFYLLNGAYMAIDSHVYYAFIRHFNPKKIIEIGAGYSTLLAACAGAQNLKEKGSSPRLIAVDPYPNELIKEGFPGLSQLIESKVQDVPLDLFTSLERGDILFIDSSHILRSGGDVQMEYLEILPRLSSGVIVHIHDVSLPRAYPRIYFETQHYWNEQYLLQSFLAFNSRFKVLWPGNYMMIQYPEKVCKVFPEFYAMRQSFPMSEPTAFWMGVR